MERCSQLAPWVHRCGTHTFTELLFFWGGGRGVSSFAWPLFDQTNSDVSEKKKNPPPLISHTYVDIQKPILDLRKRAIVGKREKERFPDVGASYAFHINSSFPSGALTLGPYTDRCLAKESVLGQLAGRTEMSAPSADSASHWGHNPEATVQRVDAIAYHLGSILGASESSGTSPPRVRLSKPERRPKSRS